MIIFIILGVVVLLAFGVVGFLFYILKKEAQKETTTVVPIKNLSELKVSENSQQMPLGGSMLTVKEQDEIKEKIKKEYDAKEKNYQVKVQELEGELNSISDKAQQQSKEALATIDQLKKENEELKNAQNNQVLTSDANLIKAKENVLSLQQEQSVLQGRLDESQVQVQKLQEEATFFKHQMAQEINAANAQVEQLTLENQAFKNKQQESPELTALVEELKNENEQLKSNQNKQIMALEANLIKAEASIKVLQQEKMELQNQFSETEAQLKEMKETEAFSEQQTEDKHLALKKQVEDLTIENQALKNSVDAIKGDIAEEFQTKMDAADQESKKVTDSQQELIQENKTLKETNEELSKNSESLQWELTKTRAQMTSFERACENYQLQLKEALDRSNSSDVNQTSVTETNSRLQLELDEVKKKNQEYSKREQLLESEFENFRNQIVTLERECQQLKIEAEKGS